MMHENHRFPRTTILLIFGAFSLPLGSSELPIEIPFFLFSFSVSRSLCIAETATPAGTSGECNGSLSSRFGYGCGAGGGREGRASCLTVLVDFAFFFESFVWALDVDAAEVDFCGAWYVMDGF